MLFDSHVRPYRTSSILVDHAMDAAAKEHARREAGRNAEIATVRALLGVPIDHFAAGGEARRPLIIEGLPR